MGYLKMFKCKSNSGRWMFSSINRVMTPIGPRIQGTPRGQAEVLPYFIMITEVEPDTLPELMYYNPSSNDLIDEADFLSLGRVDADTTGDSVDGSASVPV